MSRAAIRPVPRSVAGHVVVATLAGGAGGAGVAFAGALVAVLWPGGEDPISDPGALFAAPTGFAIAGGVLGLVLGLGIGVTTLRLRTRPNACARRDVAAVATIVVAVVGGVPLSWLWGDAMGAGVPSLVGAVAFCSVAAQWVARLAMGWLLGPELRTR